MYEKEGNLWLEADMNKSPSGTGSFDSAQEHYVSENAWTRKHSIRTGSFGFPQRFRHVWKLWTGIHVWKL